MSEYQEVVTEELDLYLLELSKQLSISKLTRKQVEDENSKMQNRLNLLRKEEGKTVKKLERARTMVQMRFDQLDKEQLSSELKRNSLAAKDKEVEQKRLSNKQMKEAIEIKKQERKSSLERIIRVEAFKTKEARAVEC